MTYLVDNEGITSFKLFMAYPGVLYSDDGQILRAMQTANESGAMIMMHAENGIAIDVLVAQAHRPRRDRSRGTTRSPGRPSSRARPRTGRSSWPRSPATCRCTSSTCRRRRRSRRSPRPATPASNVFAETCPQYLYLSLEDQLAQPGFEGAKWVCSTPLRTKHEHHQRDLWKGLRMNELAVVSTDHCPFCFKEQKEMGIGDFSKIPNGIGGVEHRMELLYQGVVNGEIIARALGRDVLHDAGADVRHVPDEGDHRPRRRRRHPRVGPRRAHVDRRRQEAPHEHGPLGVGGLRDRRQGRHRAQPRPGDRRGRHVHRRRRATAGTSSAACPQYLD